MGDARPAVLHPGTPDPGAVAAVTVGLVAGQIAAADVDRAGLIIQNLGAADVYVGGSAVTTASGIKIASGGVLTLETGAAVYAVSGSAGQDVRVLQEAV